MPKLKIILTLCGALALVGIGPEAADDASFSGQASASIRATAHVEPPLGLAEAKLIEATSVTDLEGCQQGSDRYWLYHPRVDGIQISVTCGEESMIACRLKDDSADKLSLRMITEHDFASLVDLSGLKTALDGQSNPATITLIYTDN
jgi:hypothetical protein